MTLTLTPCTLQGEIIPPPSKSYCHRALIAAALAGKSTHIHNLARSQDIDATRRCLTALKEDPNPLPLLDCGESGSTLRFLIPIALVLRGGGRFTGSGRLMQRPQEPYFQLFQEKGISYALERDILTVSGGLTPGEYRLAGNVSSQFFTGLLYALPLLEGDSTLLATTPLESRGYIDMTLHVLDTFGICAEPVEDGWHIPGRQHYVPGTLTVEADWSQGAFFLAAAGLGNALAVNGLDPNSAQGDRMAASYMEQLNQTGDLELDVSQCPDLVPPLALRAAVRRGTARLTNAARLRIKESDRLASVTEVLNALGARVEEFPDSLCIRGVEQLDGGVELDSHNDHRIAMMAAMAVTRCAAPVTLSGAQCVEKSYPTFWQDYTALGGLIQEVVS